MSFSKLYAVLGLHVQEQRVKFCECVFIKSSFSLTSQVYILKNIYLIKNCLIAILLSALISLFLLMSFQTVVDNLMKLTMKWW
jgi:hypothetical protein